MIQDVRYHETKALDCEIRALLLRRAADRVSPEMTLGELDAIKRDLVTECEKRLPSGGCLAAVRLQGWGETAVPGLEATPSEALADSLRGLALMLDRRAEGQRNMARRWLERMEVSDA